MGNYSYWDRSYCVQSIVADVYESNLYQLMRMIFRLCWFLIRADSIAAKNHFTWNSLDSIPRMLFPFLVLDYWWLRNPEMELHHINNVSDSASNNPVIRTRNMIMYPEILSIMQMSAKIVFCCAAKIERTCRQYMVGVFLHLLFVRLATFGHILNAKPFVYICSGF